MRLDLLSGQGGGHQPRRQKHQEHGLGHQTKSWPAADPSQQDHLRPGSDEKLLALQRQSPILARLWSRARQRLQTGLLTNPNGPGGPTAQLAGSAPGTGGKESVQFPRALVTGLAS